MAERWPALMSMHDAAEYLGISPRSLKRLQAAERVRPVTIRDGAFLRFRRTDLDRFIDDLPFGSGTCPANEKRVAVLMLAKQRQREVRPKPQKPKPLKQQPLKRKTATKPSRAKELSK